jgi:hypothetical protein
VELRFFGGLRVEETAEVLKVSPETAMRDWNFAKSWLLRELRVPGELAPDRSQRTTTEFARFRTSAEFSG